MYVFIEYFNIVIFRIVGIDTKMSRAASRLLSHMTQPVCYTRVCSVILELYMVINDTVKTLITFISNYNDQQ